MADKFDVFRDLKPSKTQVENALDDVLVGIYLNPNANTVRRYKVILDLFKKKTGYHLNEYYEIYEELKKEYEISR